MIAYLKQMPQICDGKLLKFSQNKENGSKNTPEAMANETTWKQWVTITSTQSTCQLIDLSRVVSSLKWLTDTQDLPLT